MNEALSSILKTHSPLSPLDVEWENAMILASASGDSRRRLTKSTPGERLRQFREMIAKELVAFHDTLPVSPYSGDLKPAIGGRLWNVGIPLTLFPKREGGFNRVESIVEFCNDTEENTGLRVVDISPKIRNEVMAQAKMGAKLELKTQAKLGFPLPSVPGISVAEVGGGCLWFGGNSQSSIQGPKKVCRNGDYRWDRSPVEARRYQGARKIIY